ncbi:Metallo-dependent phosphatase-like protein [Mycena vulgaris]|nr:Metallo-dependent phosphatase-like protein [Mycena vulgaris]
MTRSLRIHHFNDVYRCSPQKISPNSSDTIDVTQFGALLDDLRAQDGTSDILYADLVLFSGDVFSPSVESSVTRGSHMLKILSILPPLNSIRPLTGNHDFDFGQFHRSNSLSNLFISTSSVPAPLHEFQILERAGLRIGIIGLTVATWPPQFEYRDMKTIGLELSRRLRGEHECDLVIALTHCRFDISLAKDLLALSPSAQAEKSVASSHGVDLILGGHDHLFFFSRGFSESEGYDTSQDILGAEADHGDVLVCKSGTDFRDLSEIILELESTVTGNIRKQVIKRITGKRHSTKAGSKSSEKLTEILKTVLSSVSSTLKAPVCNTTVAIDVRSQFIRTEEVPLLANWFADVLRHAYDDTLAMKGCGGSHGVLICAGTLRGDSVYGPGQMTLGDILEILPFTDPIVVISIDGATIWDALEASLSTFPAQEGRFPVLSGFRVAWDSRRTPGQRVTGIWLLNEDPIQKNTDQRYNIVTRQYMAEGHDGFGALQRGQLIIDDEGGQLASTIVRKYLMGSHYVNVMARLAASDVAHLHSTTKSAIIREQGRQQDEQHRPQHASVASQWQHAAHLALRWSRSRTHYQEHLNVCTLESMTSAGVDPFDGEKIRGDGKLADQRARA